METINQLGLKEVCHIVNLMGVSELISDYDGEVEVDGKKYYYRKNGNEMVIRDEDNKMLRVALRYAKEPGKDFYGRDVTFIKHEITVDYILDNGDYIRLFSNVGLNPGFEEFNNVRSEDLKTSPKVFDSAGKELGQFNLALDRICVGDIKDIVEFSDKGIEYGRKVISSDGNTLLTMSNDPVPSKEDVMSFDIEKEYKKIDEVIASSKGLHPFTLEVLEDAKRALTRKARYSDKVKDFYQNGINEVKYAIYFRNRVMDILESELIDPKGIVGVANDFYNRRVRLTPRFYQMEKEAGIVRKN